MAVNIYQQETMGERAKDIPTGLVEPKRGYRRLIRSISHVFSSGSNHQNQNQNQNQNQHHLKPESLPYQSRTHSRSHSDTHSHNSYVSQLRNNNNNNNNNNNDNNSNNENNNNNENNTDNREGSPIQNAKFRWKLEDCSECEEHGKGLDMTNNHANVVQELNAVFGVDKRLRRQTIVPVSDIRRAQQIEEDTEVQQTQQISKSQRFKSASIGNLVDLPGEDDKKSIKNRMRMKFAPSNVFRIRGDKKSRSRRSQVNSLCLDEQSKYPLFGARLNALELNMSDHPYVPRFVVDVCAHIERPDAIEQDGLYRASGNKLLVDELKLKLTHLYDPRWLQTDDIHTLTSLHKQFFRELPAPLITQEAYERLGRLTDEAAIERMRLAFDEMPEPNRSTLRFLIKHLTNVAAASGSNRMPASNLAIVWGPCLLAANVINFDIGRMNMLAKMLIENYERIFRPDNERLVC